MYCNVVLWHPVVLFNLLQYYVLKEGHAAKSAEERRHSDHNMRAHLGEIYNISNNQSKNNKS
jgi:hypothetical protein